ncbi:MAG TPA: acyl-CoA dehydrogenase family protein [Caulobacterales bacterium]|nr:acyl-CoA dehydrogenase family protein [Caulobacterales bacterium]
MTDLAAYRLRARAFLEQHAESYGWDARRGLSLAQEVDLAKRWQGMKAAHGYACITWPTEYGGAGGTELEKIVFSTEEAKYGFPAGLLAITLGMPVPMMLHHATPEQKRRYVPPAVRGEEMWCQLFSEPGAGSDLAAVRLKARRDGDDWVLSGQKIWTSYAQFCDFGILVARSDPDAPKHKGLTFFFVDMKAPGVSVRPIKLLHEHEDVNEVFFDDVRIPDANRLGAVNDGFRMAILTLMMERYVAAASDDGPPLDALVQLARTRKLRGRPAIEDGRVRAAIAHAYATQRGLAAIHERALEELTAGREPGPEGSIHKLAASRARHAMATLALDLSGPSGVAYDRDAKTRTDYMMSWIDGPTLRIAGGTDEMLLNTIAEKILGLPQDHRPDKAPRGAP